MRSMLLAQFHMTYALELIALALGIAILTWSMQDGLPGRMIARIGGGLVTIMAAAWLIGSLHYGYKFWRDSAAMMQIVNPNAQSVPSIQDQMRERIQMRMQMREKASQPNQ